MPRPACLLVAALVFPCAAGSAHAAAPNIVAPRVDQLVTAPRLTVSVRTATTATRLTARLDGKAAAVRFRRVAPGRWSATLRRTALRPGVNRLTVLARTAGGREQASAPVRVYAGTRRRAFTQVRVGARVNGSVPVALRTSADPRLRLAVTLNGRSVTRVFAPRYGARRAARLGADDGLRRGRNVLRVTAIRRDGGYTVVRRVFRVSASQALVGAGPQRRTTPRRSVILRGHHAGPRARSSSATVRWRVLSAPKGSKARPASPMQLVTRFTPDKVGTYRLQLAVGSGAGAAVDEVTVTSVANIPPIGTPVTTITERAAIVIGGATYAYDPNQDAVQVVIVDRGTLEVQYQNAFEGTSADTETLLGLLGQYSGSLVFLGNLDYNNESIVDPSWNQVVQGIGGTALPAITNGTAGWSVVGVAGAPSGSAFQNTGTAQNSANPTQGQMQGYLQLDSNDQFAFVPAERVALDLAAPGAPAGQNQMTVGSATYASGALTSGGTACSGGIQIQTLSAENLISSTGQTFATNGCGAAADAANLQAATAFLQGLGAGSSAGTLLVLVQTIGTPRDPATDAGLWQQFTNAVVSIGGTAAAVGDGSGSYSLVAGLGIADFPLAEGSSALTGQAAHVTAVLQRARNGNFVPKLSSTTGAFGFDLATLAYQAPQPFAPSTGQQAALAYIAETVLGLDAPAQGESCYVPAQPDVRSQYCNSKYYTSWSGFASQLSSLTPQSGPGFTTTDWNTVVGQLAPKEGRGEFRAVQSLWSTIQTVQNGNAQNAVTAVATAQKEAAQIVGELTSRSSALGNWLSLTGDLSDAADRLAEVVSEDLAGPLGFLAAGLLIGADTANLPNGGPDVGAFQIAASTFASQLAESYGNASGELSHLGDIIVTDAQKLSDFDQGSQYAFTPSPAVTSGITLASAQFSWTSLFPSAFTLARLPRGTGVNQGITDANSYQCSTMYGSDAGSYYPFNNAQPSQQLLTSELFVLVAAGSTLPNGSNYETPRMPTPAFMNPLFAPYSASATGISQYGMIRPWFFREAYAFGGTATVNC